MNQIDLQGRSAVVTGAARGIGYAIAQRLLASGAKVAIWDTDEPAAKSAAERLDKAGRVIALRADVTSSEDLARAVEATLGAFGQLDVLVNNAGIAGANKRLWEYDPAEFRGVVEIDLVGVFECCRAVVPTMIEAGYGRIVNIASVAGKDGNPNASPYSAAKAGVIALTKSLGKELAQSGICVNCITPAAVETDIFAQLTQQHIDFMLSKIPMGRFGRTEEIGSMVAWLASEECSFTTAGVFDISGGRSTY